MVVLFLLFVSVFGHSRDEVDKKKARKSHLIISLLSSSFFSRQAHHCGAFIFKKTYSSRTLHSVTTYIKENNHKAIKDNNNYKQKKNQTEQQEDRTHIHIHNIIII